MKLNLSLLLLVFFIISCGPPEFEKNTRILVKGIIIDQNNNPIPKTKINIYSERASGFLSSSDYLLGTSTSNQDGTFSITSFFDRTDEFQIEIIGDSIFSNYYYLTNTENYSPKNLEFDLKEVALNRLSEVTYNITKTSDSDIEFRYSFQYKNTDCFEFFNDGVLDNIRSNCLEEVQLNRLLNQNRPEISSSFITLLGIVVEFKYSINDAPEITETFTIDTENYEFNFSY